MSAGGMGDEERAKVELGAGARDKRGRVLRIVLVSVSKSLWCFVMLKGNRGMS